MTRAVLVHRSSSPYGDNPTERFYFDHTYLRVMRQTAGDHVIYFEPKSDGRQAYVASARVTHFEPLADQPNRYCAFIEPGSYIQFAEPVGYRGPSGYYETRLRRPDDTLDLGMVRRAVRLISDLDFELIFEAGMAPLNAVQDQEFHRASFELAEATQAPFTRPLESRDRPLRQKAFAFQVRRAYDNRCGITGLRILGATGNPEIEAAHIKSVAEGGPDWVRNGIALCRTAHWMYDEGIIGIAEDHRILLVPDLIPDPIRPLFARHSHLSAPPSGNLSPYPAFLRHHLDTRFKGAKAGR